jgi:hypothetical protein
VATSPGTIQDDLWIRRFDVGPMRHNVMSSRETEKRQGRSSRPQFYLSLKGLMLFQVVRGRIAYVLDLGPKSWITRLHDPDPRPYTVLSTPNDAMSNPIVLPANRSERCYGVVLFSFFGSNVSPFFQMLNAMAAILRARVSLAISARMPVCCRRST